MRIGYIVPEFPTQTHVLFWREIIALEALGIGICLISTRSPGDQTSRHAFTETAIARTTYLMPPRWGRVLAVLARHPIRALRALAYCARLRESPLAARIRTMALLVPAADLAAFAGEQQLEHLHVHSFANSAHMAAMARKLGAPEYSLTLHGDLPVYGRDHVAKSADAAFTTTVTEDLARQMRAAIPGITPEVITMGLDTGFFAPAPAPDPGPASVLTPVTGTVGAPAQSSVDALADVGAPVSGISPAPDAILAPGVPQTDPFHQPPHLVTVARLNPMKGHLDVLEALAALAAEGLVIRYTIAGEGPYRAEIEDAVARLDLGAQVDLVGALGEGEVRDLLRRADMAILASFGLGESAPVVMKEAMSCAVPVICTRIGGTAEMIQDGCEGILVAQRDIAAITSALRRLASDPGLRHQMGQAGRERALREFDSHALAARMAALFRQAVARRG